MTHTLAPRSFFARDVDAVARELVGQLLVKDGVVLRVTEVEAYGPQSDTAAHCRAGRTARTEPMFGPPGHAYVYLCYGVHWMLNLVTGAVDVPQAVLVRSCEVVGGHDVVQARRKARKVGVDVTAGPGKVAQALALDGTYNHHDLCAAGGLEVQVDASRTVKAILGHVVTGVRIGIDYAEKRDRDALRRYALGGSAAVTHRGSLRG